MRFEIGDNTICDTYFDEDEYVLTMDFYTKINGDNVVSFKCFTPEYDGLIELSQHLENIGKYLKAKHEFSQSQRTRSS